MKECVAASRSMRFISERVREWEVWLEEALERVLLLELVVELVSSSDIVMDGIGESFELV